MEHRQKDWPEWLAAAEFVVNNKVHTATKVLPFMANYGKELRMGGDIIKRYVDRGRKETEVWKKEDRVLLSTKDLVFKKRPTKKLTERYVGPYAIEEIVSSNMVKLQLPSLMRIHLVINVSWIVRYKE